MKLEGSIATTEVPTNLSRGSGVYAEIKQYIDDLKPDIALKVGFDNVDEIRKTKSALLRYGLKKGVKLSVKKDNLTLYIEKKAEK